MPSYQQFVMVNDNFDLIEQALSIGLIDFGSLKTAKGFHISTKDEIPTLFFCWSADPDGVTPFATEHTAAQCAVIATEWLKTVTYPNDPWRGGDGSSKRGWKISTEIRSHKVYSTRCAVQPDWTYYGK